MSVGISPRLSMSLSWNAVAVGPLASAVAVALFGPCLVVVPRVKTRR